MARTMTEAMKKGKMPENISFRSESGMVALRIKRFKPKGGVMDAIPIR